jgi:hypothetical protein
VPASTWSIEVPLPPSTAVRSFLAPPGWLSLVGRAHREAVEEHAAILHAAQGLEDLREAHAAPVHLRGEEARLAVLAAARDSVGEVEDEEAPRLAERAHRARAPEQVRDGPGRGGRAEAAQEVAARERPTREA